jgi:hypothetical protein
LLIPFSTLFPFCALSFCLSCSVALICSLVIGPRYCLCSLLMP